MRLVRLVGGLALLASCSPTAAPPARPPAPPAASAGDAPGTPESPSGAPAAPAPRTATTIAPETAEAAGKFAEELESAIADGDADAVRATWDVEAMAAAVCAGLTVKTGKRAEIESGLVTGLRRSVTNLVTLWSSGTSTFKRILAGEDGGVLARFRFDGSDGIAIVDFALVPRDGSFRIVDIHNRTIGTSVVAQTRQSLTPVLAQLDRGFLERLVGSKGLTKADLESYGGIPAAFSAGRHEEVVAAWKRLPSALQDASATSMYLNSLQAVDETEYVLALEAAAARFPAPLFRFSLVDAHFVRKEWAKAIRCIDEFMAAVERDAALLALRASLQNQSGDVGGAATTIREALALEPDCVFARTSALDVLLAAKDWAGVRDSMVFLEGTGGYQFKGQMDDPIWKEFLGTPEAAAWR